MGRALLGRRSHSNRERRADGVGRSRDPAVQQRRAPWVQPVSRAGPGKTAAVKGAGRGAAEWGKVDEGAGGQRRCWPVVRPRRNWAGLLGSSSAAASLGFRPEGKGTWLRLLASLAASRSLFMPHCLSCSAAVQSLSYLTLFCILESYSFCVLR